MKKIISGKVYDTDTAERVGEWDNGRLDDCLYRCCEELYRKRTGEFFLYGYGGPGSKYSVSLGNDNWSGGEKIIPLSYDAAQKWAEDHLDGEEYESIFGTVTEDDSRVNLTVSVAAGTIKRAKMLAAQANMSLSAYIESLIP